MGRAASLAAMAGFEQADSAETPPTAKMRAQALWRERAADYARLAGPAAAQLAPHMLLMGEVRARKRVLDLGCGAGALTGAAYALGADALGVDLSPAMIAAARERFPKVRFMIGAAEALAEQAETYDVALCNVAAPAFADPTRAFREAYRALKPGGRMVWSVWLAPSGAAFLSTARASLGVVRQQGLGDDASANEAMRAAGFAPGASETVEVLIETAGEDAGRLARLMDDQVDAAAAAREDGDAKLATGLSRFLRNGRLEARSSARIFVAEKPAAAQDYASSRAASASKRGSFGLVGRLLGGGQRG